MKVGPCVDGTWIDGDGIIDVRPVDVGFHPTSTNTWQVVARTAIAEYVLDVNLSKEQAWDQAAEVANLLWGEPADAPTAAAPPEPEEGSAPGAVVVLKAKPAPAVPPAVQRVNDLLRAQVNSLGQGEDAVYGYVRPAADADLPKCAFCPSPVLTTHTDDDEVKYVHKWPLRDRFGCDTPMPL